MAHCKGSKGTAGKCNRVPVNITRPKAIVFFIGGAADKKPFKVGTIKAPAHWLMKNGMLLYKKKISTKLTKDKLKLVIDDERSYLGYYEIYKDQDVKKKC